MDMDCGAMYSLGMLRGIYVGFWCVVFLYLLVRVSRVVYWVFCNSRERLLEVRKRFAEEHELSEEVMDFVSSPVMDLFLCVVTIVYWEFRGWFMPFLAFCGASYIVYRVIYLHLVMV